MAWNREAISLTGPGGAECDCDGNDPAVAYNSTANQYLVVWQGDDDTDFGNGPLMEDENEIFGQLVNADGSEDGSDIRLSNTLPEGDPEFDGEDPAVAFNSTGAVEFLTVWEADTNVGILVEGEDEIYGQRFAPAIGDLSLTKEVDDATPEPGENVTFTLTVTNDGPDTVEAIEVTDLLPSGLTYVSDSGGGDYTSGTGVWQVGDLALDGEATLMIETTVESTTTITNTAEITAAQRPDPDSTPANGEASEDDQASAPVTAVDTIAPAAPTITGGPTLETDDRTPVISGTAEPDSTVTVVIDLGDGSSVTYEATADGDGNWSIDLETATPTSGTFPEGGLSDGSYPLSMTATDAANNTSDPTQATLVIEGGGGPTDDPLTVYLPLIRR